jgi:hypothetical protein
MTDRWFNTIGYADYQKYRSIIGLRLFFLMTVDLINVFFSQSINYQYRSNQYFFIAIGGHLCYGLRGTHFMCGGVGQLEIIPNVWLGARHR